MKLRAKEIYTVCILFIVLIIILGIADIKKQRVASLDTTSMKRHVVDIILSPHYDDAVLSLGGMIDAHTNKKVIATFFTSDSRGVSHTQWDTWSGFSNSLELVRARAQENANALSHFKDTNLVNYTYSDFQYDNRTSSSSESLRKNIVTDINHLLTMYGDTEIHIYGPSYFGTRITHPDHALLHSAFIELFKNTHNTHITFYLYEDFPYINRYLKEVPNVQLDTYIANSDGVDLHPYPVYLNQENVLHKNDALHEYVSQIRALSRGVKSDITTLDTIFNEQRCSKDPIKPYACEIVYELSHKIETR